jgi:hypothetical protein
MRLYAALGMGAVLLGTGIVVFILETTSPSATGAGRPAIIITVHDSSDPTPASNAPPLSAPPLASSVVVTAAPVDSIPKAEGSALAASSAQAVGSASALASTSASKPPKPPVVPYIQPTSTGLHILPR